MPTAPGYADCSVKLQLSTMARPAYITFGLNPNETAADFIAQELLNSWLYTGSMNSRLDATVTAAEFTVRLGQDGGEDLVGSVTNATPGGTAGSTPPPNVAVLVHKRTARGGRRGRGRLYLPWFVTTNNVEENGVIQAATVTAITTAINVWKGRLSASNMPMVVLHNEGQSPQGAPDVVTSLVVSPVVATQKRRLARV